jgi:hypothetical protein
MAIQGAMYALQLVGAVVQLMAALAKAVLIDGASKSLPRGFAR